METGRTKEFDEEKISILQPKAGKLISEFTKEVVSILKDENILFFRSESRDIVEIGKITGNNKETYMGFIITTPNRFITFVEKYFTPVIYVKIKNEDGSTNYKLKPMSVSRELANTILKSNIIEESLPTINRIFTVPLPIIYEKNLTFPKIGYDERFKSWMPHSIPKIENTEMSLAESKKIIYELLKEFCFSSNQDYVNAVAALITPFLRGLYYKFNCRTPLFFYIGNRERVGKDYLAGVAGVLYEGVALEEPPICISEKNSGNDEELRKKIMSAFLSGRKRLHFANNKGYLNNSVFEAAITNTNFSDRLLGKNEILSFENEIEFSLSGNIGIGFTPDLAYRSRFIHLFYEEEDVNSRIFEKPNLHIWIYENRGLILSAIYGLIKNWFNNGCPDGKVNFSSFPEWARVCGGIMESAGYTSPCTTDKEVFSLGGDSDTNEMKRLFEFCYEKNPEKWMKKHEIRDLIRQEQEDLFSYFNFDTRSDQVKFGNKIIKFVGRIMSDIILIIKDKTVRSARQEFMFTKNKQKNDKTNIFKDSQLTNTIWDSLETQNNNNKDNTCPDDGNLGNLLTSLNQEIVENDGNRGNLGNLYQPSDHLGINDEMVQRTADITIVTKITTRDDILKSLKDRELSLSELFEKFSVTYPEISMSDFESFVDRLKESGDIFEISYNRFKIL